MVYRDAFLIEKESTEITRFEDETINIGAQVQESAAQGFYDLANNSSFDFWLNEADDNLF